MAQNPGQELSSIDFESMIGGPLLAVVNAQAQSAQTTVNFVKSVGFKEKDELDDEGGNTGTAEPIYVSFTYPKEIAPYQPEADGNAAVPAKYEDQELRVPILTLMPIPYLRIEETTVDFNAKINSVISRKTDETTKTSANLEGKYGWLLGSVKLKASFSYQKNTQSGSRVERTYTMAVHVRAVQDELPGGMERMMGILEDAIVSQPIADSPEAHPVDR